MESWSFEVAGKRDQQMPRLGTNIKHPDVGSSRLERKSPAEPMLTTLLVASFTKGSKGKRRLFRDRFETKLVRFLWCAIFSGSVEELREQCHVFMEVWNQPDCMSVSPKISASYFVCFLPRFSLFHLTALPTCSPPSTLKLLSVPPSGTTSGKQFPYFIVGGCPLIFQWIFWIISLHLIGVSLPSNKRNSAAKIAPTSSDLIRPVQHPASWCSFTMWWLPQCHATRALLGFTGTIWVGCL